MENMTKSDHKEIAGCLTNLLFAINQLHYTHWLTVKNHHHEIIGTLYENLQDEVDELAEQFMGANTPAMLPEKSLMADMMTKQKFNYQKINREKEIIEYLDYLVAKVEKGISIVEKYPKLKFMFDTLSDIGAELHSAKYQIQQQ